MNIHDINLTGAVRTSHEKAAADVKDLLPQLKANDIISLVLACAEGKKDPLKAAAELAEKYKEPAQKYVRIFCETFAAETIDQVLKKSDDQAAVSLSGDGFAKVLVSSGEKIGFSVSQYISHEIDDEAFISTLYMHGIFGIGIPILKANGIDTERLMNSTQEASEVLRKSFSEAKAPADGIRMADLYSFQYLAGCMAAYTAFTEVYRLLQQSLSQAELSYDQRILAEEVSRQNITRIRTCREDMDRIVSQYLNEHLASFQSGMQSMDQAILGHDTDGYLRGNIEIQKALGYKMQFSTQDEFDALMDSDEPFHL